MTWACSCKGTQIQSVSASLDKLALHEILKHTGSTSVRNETLWHNFPGIEFGGTLRISWTLHWSCSGNLASGRGNANWDTYETTNTALWLYLIKAVAAGASPSRISCTRLTKFLRGSCEIMIQSQPLSTTPSIYLRQQWQIQHIMLHYPSTDFWYPR